MKFRFEATGRSKVFGFSSLAFVLLACFIHPIPMLLGSIYLLIVAFGNTDIVLYKTETKE